MICFFFIIFALSNTIDFVYQDKMSRCDLLLFYYFCTVKHNRYSYRAFLARVVICFFFIIFALSNTIELRPFPIRSRLWFASFLLFLHCQTQCEGVESKDRPSCDLLLFYYFCTVKHNEVAFIEIGRTVVICFFFIIFALSNTIMDL